MSEADHQKHPWRLAADDDNVHLILSEEALAASGVLGGQIAGYGLLVHVLAADEPVDKTALNGAQALVIEALPGSEASLQRLIGLRDVYPQLPVIAAVRDASVPMVRALMHAGVLDIVSIPLNRDELSSALAKVREASPVTPESDVVLGKTIAVIGSVGGVGATTFATQAAILQSERDGAAGSETCLVDLDLQTGGAANYLGIHPRISVHDLLDAGGRLDRAMLRTAAAQGNGALRVMGAPTDIVPLESVQTDQALKLVDLAAREFRTVFLDLPGSWTNWSLSLVGRANLVIMIVELSVGSLRQARRQLQLLSQQGLGHVPIMIVANRVQKRLFKTINLEEASRALHHQISHSIGNDFPLVSAALDQGVPIGDIKPKSAIAKDIAAVLTAADVLMERSS